MGALEDLLASWRSNPNADATLAICGRLSATKKREWVREVGASAETWHHRDARVMLAVGQMYLAAGFLDEAQTTFVSAGKLDASAPEPFRCLGETLLRRGDAVRAEKLFARAAELGASARELRPLREQAAGFAEMQARYGQERVASEVARALSASGAAVAVGGVSMEAKNRSKSRPPKALAEAEAPLPSFDLNESEVSEVYELAHSAAARAGAGARTAGRAPQRALASAGPPKAPGPLPPPPSPLRAPRMPEPSEEDVTELVSSSPSFDDIPTDVKRPQFVPSAPPSPAAAPAASRAPLPPLRAPLPAPGPMGPPAPAVQADSVRAAWDDSAARADDPIQPSPAILLQHLARVGLFEAGGGAAPAWEAAPKQKARGVIPLVLLIVLVAGGGAGGYEYARRLKADRVQQSTALITEVDKLLHSGKISELSSTDAKLSRVFDLDSRSQRAGRLWLENRVLGALLLPSEPRGIDSAVYRGREVGLRERELAVGRVASFLVEGDLAGAAAMLPKWDAEAGNDAHYQLLAGAVLERAGDARALERYDAARSLDPKLVPADLMLARLLLLEQGTERARPILEELRKKLSADDPSLRALEALSWAADPARAAELPESLRLRPEDAARLPAPLRAVPAMVDATLALAKNDLPGAAKALDAALLLTDGPALAASLGFVAIDAGDEQLARKAALRALSFAAMYPRARTLAARVALLGGRLDEAQKAVEELDPKSPDVRVVRGVVAYETGDSSELSSALASLGSNQSAPEFAALAAGPGILLASRYLDPQKLEGLAQPSVPWGEIIAADSALDTGNLPLAERVLATRIAGNAAPVHLFRIARLRRYQKRIDDALTASERALSEKPSVPLVIERVLELIEKDRGADARDLVARYPALLGQTAGWLGVLLDMAANQPKQAAARLAQLEPPPEEAPVFLRLVAGRALVVASDKRGRPYVLSLARHLGKHPDLLQIAALLNGH